MRARVLSNSDGYPFPPPACGGEGRRISRQRYEPGWGERPKSAPTLDPSPPLAALAGGGKPRNKESGTPAVALSSVPACKRRAGRATDKAACAALRLRARSPAGVTPRLCPRGVWSLGAIRARLRGEGLPSQFQRRTSHTGRNAGRLMPEPPGSEADEALPAGTALAPCRPASPGRRPYRGES